MNTDPSVETTEEPTDPGLDIDTGTPDGEGDPNDQSVFDELDLGTPDTPGSDDPGVDPTEFNELKDAVTKLTTELEAANQRARSAEGRVKRENRRSQSTDDFPDGSEGLTDEGRILLQRQVERERREDERWRKFEEVNALKENGMTAEQAEEVWELENSDDPQDYVDGLQLRNQFMQQREQERRDRIKRQQLADRGQLPSNTAGGGAPVDRQPHTARTVATAIIDKQVDPEAFVGRIAKEQGQDFANEVMQVHGQLIAEGYQPPAK